ncbi:hypothetical protein SAMN05216403_1501 [Nitrosospira multiformis ATCC 25196]|uniref:Uncharacterized protein n=1 Tax=Nitrosospira multiformis (strain ATCC 25196 / NCIMB 11849 / C 71) TaxID=323848 RepID=A0A1H5Y879_NITMU|nr:hypothetical protein SAMN05216403_1501 [Nitrosospira multiformis ATCC 25196]
MDTSFKILNLCYGYTRGYTPYPVHYELATRFALFNIKQITSKDEFPEEQIGHTYTHQEYECSSPQLNRTQMH